ncbi:MAG: alpha/beta hydrolase [Planctomycetota bacterium]
MHQARSKALSFAVSPRRAGGVLLRVLGGLLAVLAALAALGAACGSLPSEEVRERILALPKNAPFEAALVPSVRTSGGTEVLSAHFPASDEAEKTGRSIVLVHGTPDSMGAWEPLMFGPGALAGQEDVWTLEILGHGMSPAGGGEVTFQRCADFIGEALAALDLEEVTLVGNSYGGEFCWRAALDHADRIARLVVIDSSGLPRAEHEFLSEEVKMREWSVARLGYLLNSESRVGFALDPHFDGAADPERVREVFLTLENRGNWNAMIDLVRDENGLREGDLAGLSTPTLLLWGEHDAAYPPERFGRRFEETIPDARLVVIEGAGHYPHEQDPARVAREILAFHRAEGEAIKKRR